MTLLSRGLIATVWGRNCPALRMRFCHVAVCHPPDGRVEGVCLTRGTDTTVAGEHETRGPPWVGLEALLHGRKSAERRDGDARIHAALAGAISSSKEKRTSFHTRASFPCGLSCQRTMAEPAGAATPAPRGGDLSALLWMLRSVGGAAVGSATPTATAAQRPYFIKSSRKRTARPRRRRWCSMRPSRPSRSEAAGARSKLSARRREVRVRERTAERRQFFGFPNFAHGAPFSRCACLPQSVLLSARRAVNRIADAGVRDPTHGRVSCTGVSALGVTRQHSDCHLGCAEVQRRRDPKKARLAGLRRTASRVASSSR